MEHLRTKWATEIHEDGIRNEITDVRTATTGDTVTSWVDYLQDRLEAISGDPAQDVDYTDFNTLYNALYADYETQVLIESSSPSEFQIPKKVIDEVRWWYGQQRTRTAPVDRVQVIGALMRYQRSQDPDNFDANEESLEAAWEAQLPNAYYSLEDLEPILTASGDRVDNPAALTTHMSGWYESHALTFEEHSRNLFHEFNHPYAFGPDDPVIVEVDLNMFKHMGGEKPDIKFGFADADTSSGRLRGFYAEVSIGPPGEDGEEPKKRLPLSTDHFTWSTDRWGHPTKTQALLMFERRDQRANRPNPYIDYGSDASLISGAGSEEGRWWTDYVDPNAPAASA